MDQSTAASLKSQHGTIKKAAAAAGIPRSTFADILSGKTRRSRTPGHGETSADVAAPGVATGDSAKRPKVKARTLSEFRQTFDKDYIVPTRIRSGLAELGSDGWEYEAQFAKICGLPLSDLGNYREAFLEFVVTIRERRAWAGSKAMAAKMRSML